ncbi:hypothetical protein SAMN04487897_10888 [Paenibacillus sp. yr247]|uniref:hypothetical protein n=1 Tax=Paenibacillus sp. yr247 TaxID=1761880 RepID=UPI00087EEAC1|nr:hypothetical protein [Paenibacillus sp. yr247]SDO10065.1 hypothetical protein SAMN04487897_10888 [Paenibacillus sp. yr247]
MPSTAQQFQIKSIGHHEDQEKLDRPQGFPYYHGLQTFAGDGEFALEGKKYGRY